MNRRALGIIMAVVMASVALVAGPVRPAAAATPPWWDGSWSHRLGVTVQTADPLDSGYSIKVIFDHATAVSASNSLSSGDDLRVVRWDGSAWTELDRVLPVGSSWNSATTEIYFRTQTAVAGSSTDTSYYVYYGNASAGAPPANANNVYDLFDDFSGGSLDGAKWASFGQPGVTVSQTGGQLKISGTSEAGSEGNPSYIDSVDTFTGNMFVESSFSIVSQSTTAQVNWWSSFGLDADLYVNRGSDPDNSIIGPDGPVAPTSLTGQTFTDQRIGQSWSSDGSAQHFENGTLMAAVSGVATSRTAIFSYSPNIAAETFDVRFDDIVVRKYVTNEPVVTVTTQEQTSNTTVTFSINPTLTLTVGDEDWSSCNYVANTVGTSATGSSVDLGDASTTSLSYRNQTLKVTTNAEGGYIVYARYSGSPGIADWSGTNASPTTSWAGGTEAFGYTTNDQSLGSGTADRFNPTNDASGARFAAMTTTNSEVAYSPAPVLDAANCVGYQAGVSGTTPAGSYSTIVTYTAVAAF